MEVKCLAWGHLNRLLDSSPDSAGSSCVWRTVKGTEKMYSRMLSVVSCTVSVLRRLSANIKAPVSTVSRSSVAECSCSLVGSSLHAAWARGCSKLFTVSTIAWTAVETKVTWRNPILTLSHSLIPYTLLKMMAHQFIVGETVLHHNYWRQQSLGCNSEMQWLFIYHVDKSWQQQKG